MTPEESHIWHDSGRGVRARCCGRRRARVARSSDSVTPATCVPTANSYNTVVRAGYRPIDAPCYCICSTLRRTAIRFSVGSRGLAVAGFARAVRTTKEARDSPEYVSRRITLRSPGRGVLANRGGYGRFDLPGDVQHREWTAHLWRAVLAWRAFVRRFPMAASVAVFPFCTRSRLLRGWRLLLRSLLLLLWLRGWGHARSSHRCDFAAYARGRCRFTNRLLSWS